MLYLVTHLATKTGGKKSFSVLTDAETANEAKSLAAAIVKFHGKANPQFNLDGYFKTPFVVEAPEVDDLPEEDTVDFGWLDRYEPTQDKKGFIPRSEALRDSQSSNDGERPSHSQEPRAYFAKMSHSTKVVAIEKHGFGVIDTVLTKAQMKDVIDTAISGEDPYYADLIKATQTSAIMSMETARYAAFIAGIVRRYERDDLESTFVNMRKYAESLLAEQVGPLRTNSGALASTNAPKSGTPIASFEELETVVYLAHYPSDFNIGNPPSSIVNAIGEAKKRKDESPATWFGQLRETPCILNFSREAVGALIRNSPENIYMPPGALRSYINANLIEVDAKPVQQNTETVQQTGAEAQQAASDAGEKDEMVAEFETERRAWLRTEIRAALNGTTTVMGESDVSELIAAIGDVSRGSIARLLAKEIETCDPFNQLVADDVHHITCDVLENWTDDKEQRVAFLDQRVEYNLQEARRESERKCQEIAATIDATADQSENPEPTRVDASNEGEKTEVADPAKGELRSIGGGHFSYDPAEMFAASPLAKVDAAGATTGDDVREFLDSSTETAEVSGETAELSGVQVDTAAQDEVQSEATAAIDDTPRREEPAAPSYFEPGRYLDIPNEVYHSANGISSTMAKDARISLMYYHGRHVIKTIQRERTDPMTFGSLVHALALEPEKLDEEFSVEPVIPEGAFTDTASMRAFIEQHNATLPKQTDADTLRAVIEKHNATLQAPYALGGNADEIGQFYMLLPPEFQSIPEDAKITATAMKACIKEYNATLPEPLKTTGGRDALLEQLATIDPEFVEKERAIPAPLPVSGSKEDMAARIKTILPTAVFADEVISAWKNNNDQRQTITQAQMKHAKAIQHALLSHPEAGKWLQHPRRATEVSYFGIDEETGLEVRVRPDLEIDTGARRIAVDLKTVSLPNVKQDNLRYRLHREIIERDYHMSAGMYCDVGMFDQFFWIFVNKEPGYHWVAVVEASADELALGRAIYKQQLAAIRNAMNTGIWPEPITEVFTDTLTDYELSRLKELNGEPS